MDEVAAEASIRSACLLDGSKNTLSLQVCNNLCGGGGGGRGRERRKKGQQQQQQEICDVTNARAFARKGCKGAKVHKKREIVVSKITGIIIYSLH
jgi:hypothetical protein